MYIFIIQPKPPQKYLSIGYESNQNHEVRLKAFKLKTGLKDAILRQDLAPKGKYSSSLIAKACLEIIEVLKEVGYLPIHGSALLNKYRQTYVIWINSDSSNRLYVGESKYPPEIRFLQHQVGVFPARVFKNGHHKAHSLATNFMDNKKYYSKDDATFAESALAELLKQYRYYVYGGH